MVSRIVIETDPSLHRFARGFAVLSETDGKLVMVRALKRGGGKMFTRVKRTLSKETGIKYGKVGAAVENKPAPNFANLAYTLRGTGNETNLNLFGARQGKRGVSARPWAKRRTFKSSFIVPAYGGKVMIRTKEQGRHMRSVYGPNIGREMVRDYTVDAWKAEHPALMARIDHELYYRISQLTKR